MITNILDVNNDENNIIKNKQSMTVSTNHFSVINTKENLVSHPEAVDSRISDIDKQLIWFPIELINNHEISLSNITHCHVIFIKNIKNNLIHIYHLSKGAELAEHEKQLAIEAAERENDDLSFLLSSMGIFSPKILMPNLTSKILYETIFNQENKNYFLLNDEVEVLVIKKNDHPDGVGVNIQKYLNVVRYQEYKTTHNQNERIHISYSLDDHSVKVNGEIVANTDQIVESNFHTHFNVTP